MTQLYRSYQQQKLHESKVNGCLFFYVKCSDAGITIDKDNKRTVIEDNLEVYEQDMVNVFCPLRRYLALQYFEMHGTRMGITFRYECYHSCTNFIAQTDGCSCSKLVCFPKRFCLM